MDMVINENGGKSHMENVMEMEKTLDVREMQPKDRHQRIFDTFKSLNPGESFVLINDHEPRPLLYQFQAEYDGEFEWWPLEQGPVAWRVSIAKRKVKAIDRTITDYFQTDHRRLDSIFGGFQEAYKEERWDDAKRLFNEFSLGLKRHIKAEEEILFPVFEEKTGMTEAGPTFVMRMEHKEIKELLDKITEGIGRKDSVTVRGSEYNLTNILSDHNMKEEHILYPESDSFIEDPDRAQVIKKTQAL
jgi:uncharacterized protein (DUF2249 family)